MGRIHRSCRSRVVRRLSEIDPRKRLKKNSFIGVSDTLNNGRRTAIDQRSNTFDVLERHGLSIPTVNWGERVSRAEAVLVTTSQA